MKFCVIEIVILCIFYMIDEAIFLFSLITILYNVVIFSTIPTTSLVDAESS